MSTPGLTAHPVPVHVALLQGCQRRQAVPAPRPHRREPLPDYSMLKYPGSLLAASAVYVARKTPARGVERGDEAHTRYTEAEIRPCANAMARL